MKHVLVLTTHEIIALKHVLANIGGQPISSIRKYIKGISNKIHERVPINIYDKNHIFMTDLNLMYYKDGSLIPFDEMVNQYILETK